MSHSVEQALADRGVDEYWAVIIEAPDRDEPRALAGVTVDAPDEDTGNRELQLAEDPDAERETDRTFELQSSGGFRQMVTPNRYGAIAYYLSVLEQHDLEEKAVSQSLAEIDGIDMEAYDEWRTGLSQSDRRLRVVDQLEERIDHGGFNLEPYLEEGTYRRVGLDDGQRRVALRLRSESDANPRRCYENAYRAVAAYDGGRDVQYVEGVALGKHPGRISAHAWVEIDGHVAELTWPWHSPDPTDAVYFGVPIDEETLHERANGRDGMSNPAILTNDELDRLAAFKAEDE